MHSNPLLSFIILLSIVSSLPCFASVQYPIMDQLPLVARVNSQYSWSINSETFSDDSAISHSELPPWLSYSDFTFSGTPTSADVGQVSIVMNPGTDNENAFSICVTRLLPPTLAVPISQQFTQDNPSLSSVFLVHPNTALGASTLPALRVPPQWSFSIGLQGGTYLPGMADGQAGNLFYYALQDDGTPLPEWVTFDSNSMTFDGVTRSPPTYESEVFTFVLIASDQQGFQAARSPFQLVVASHELSYTETNPVLPINATTGQPMLFSFKTDDWIFGGVMRDNSTLNSSDISSLDVDTSAIPWLSYDPSTLTLSGTAPSEPGTFPLPLRITGYNQTLNVHTSAIILPSYFVNNSFNSVYASAGSNVDIDLSSHIDSLQPSYQSHNVTLTADFDPSSISSFLRLSSDANSGSYAITGTVPMQLSTSHVNITLQAYDHTTHTDAHANLLIAFRVPSNAAKSQSTTLAQRRQLILGLTIGFGCLGAIILITGTMAIIRKYCAVKDPAVGAGGYSNGGNPYAMNYDLEGYGWSEKFGMGGNPHLDPSTIFVDAKDPQIPIHSPKYDGVGIGYSPAMIRKGNFFQGVRNVVRKFSAPSTRRSKKSLISKPILMFTKNSDDSLAREEATPIRDTSPNTGRFPPTSVPSGFQNLSPGDGDGLSFGLNSTPTSEGHSAEGSIPRQRPDFGPSKNNSSVRPPAPAVIRTTPKGSKKAYKGKGKQGVSASQTQSTHDLDDAIITTASRAPSLHSGRSSLTGGTADGPTISRPRLVQFTSARGVPAPVPNVQTVHAYGNAGNSSDTRRASQMAAVVDPSTPEDNDLILTEGMRYVRAFGDSIATSSHGRSNSNSKRSSRSGASGKLSPCATTASTRSPIPTQSSSYVYPSPSASFDSEMNQRGSLVISRILVREGEAFAFKYPVAFPPPVPGSSGPISMRKTLAARRLYDGARLPSFLSFGYGDLKPGSGRTAKRQEVEFWGTPGSQDVGEVIVGIFDDQDVCVGKLVVEVVARS